MVFLSSVIYLVRIHYQNRQVLTLQETPFFYLIYLLSIYTLPNSTENLRQLSIKTKTTAKNVMGNIGPKWPN